jgi:hypothetical protein
MSRIYFVLLLLLTANAFGQIGPSDTVVYKLYMIGDAGKAGPRPVLDLLQQHLAREQAPSGVIFLGDNIYQNGMPPVGHKTRLEAEQAIDGQINILKNYRGDIFFIPGNHDWKQGKEGGWDYLMRQEHYVEAALDSADVFFPSDGCPGPIEIPLTDKIILVILDTQWILNKGDKPGRTSSCGSKTGEEIFLLLEDILLRNQNKKVIVATHHPMVSKGPHGGVMTFNDHLFPLTKINPKLYIPLPVIGSIYPLHASLIGTSQDLANLEYQQMVKAITQLLEKHEDLTHISGHEHALQHLAEGGIQYVVSGSGSKLSHVKAKRPSKFAGNYHGFGTLEYYASGDTKLSFYTPDTDNELIYETLISTKPYIGPVAMDSVIVENFPKGDVLTNASDLYEGAGFRRFMFGEGYRAEWYEGVEVPVFDLGKEKGGLTILKRGGGNQTKSLRLEAKDGKQYVLRLLEKDASKLIPDEYRSNFVKKVVQEGISGSHPYAAFTVPELADAVGVYHTNPKLMFVPKDPRLGIYERDFGNKLALFEERAAKDQSDAPYFGNAEEIINTPKMLKNLYKDNDNRIDQEAVLSARLLDMLLGDWDRHDDQWRWAEFDHKGKGKTYKPIPRDRDQVFYISEGLIPGLAGSSWAAPAMQGFDFEIKNVGGLWSFAARFFDRSFLNELSLEQWQEIARQQQKMLTDAVIENAVKDLPPEVYSYHGEEIVAKLKKRRDDLVKYATTYYHILADEVEVVGSNKHEYFDVERLNDIETRVTVYKMSKGKKKGKIIYQRNFSKLETREIRLYGLAGEDEFHIRGDVNKGIRVRIIGGEDTDKIVDNSRVKGSSRKTLVYDTKEGNELILGDETRDKTSTNPEVNHYDRKAFMYNYLGPVLSFNVNKDDGLFIGAGAHITTHSFRKTPFQSDHVVVANTAIATASFFLSYEGKFTDIAGKADLEIVSELRSPNFVTNFFGMGNETPYQAERGIDYYRVRFKQFWLDTKLSYGFGRANSFKIGPTFQTVDVENTPDRFISDFAENGLDSTTVFLRKLWLGVKSELILDSRDHKKLPQKGVYWHTSMTWYYGMTNFSGNYSQFKTDFSFYYSFRMPARVTLANRTGFAQNFGDFEFYQANYLDGHDQLRGYRKYRFAGKRSFYNNVELRVKLFKTRALIVPTQFGLVGFYDFGRVWLATDTSEKWHQAYGGGLWIAPTRLITFTFIYGFSEEGAFPLLNVGFFF